MTAKVLLVAMLGAFSALVAFNNLTDYDSNYEFVHHVFMMDTTFSGNKGMWRAIDAPFMHHAGYILIIAGEVSVAVLAILGAARLWRAKDDAAAFNRAKPAAIWALVLGILLWFGGFIVVGGEWFLMWQSQIWNGQQSAFRIVTVFSIVLVFLCQPDRAETGAP